MNGETKRGDTLYVKDGRRYRVWGHTVYDFDCMKAGQWRMTYCPGDGSYHYRYDVRPDTASFMAAAELAREAMMSAMTEAARVAPQLGSVPP